MPSPTAAAKARIAESLLRQLPELPAQEEITVHYCRRQHHQVVVNPSGPHRFLAHPKGASVLAQAVAGAEVPRCFQVVRSELHRLSTMNCINRFPGLLPAVQRWKTLRAVRHRRYATEPSAISLDQERILRRWIARHRINLNPTLGELELKVWSKLYRLGVTDPKSSMISVGPIHIYNRKIYVASAWHSIWQYDHRGHLTWTAPSVAVEDDTEFESTTDGLSWTRIGPDMKVQLVPSPGPSLRVRLRRASRLANSWLASP